MSRKVKMSKLKLPVDDPRNQPRVCTTCGEEKPSDQYQLERDKRATNGIAQRSTCKPCTEHRKYKAFIKKTYDITWEDYEAMYDKQRGCCAICKSRISSSRTQKLYVDHCHQTLRVRGLLCGNCNNGLGQFKDSPRLLQRAINYLSDGE